MFEWDTQRLTPVESGTWTPLSPSTAPSHSCIPAPSGTCMSAECQAEPVQVTLVKLGLAGWRQWLGRGIPFYVTAPPHAAHLQSLFARVRGRRAAGERPAVHPACAGRRAGQPRRGRGQCNFPVPGARPLGEPRPGGGGWEAMAQEEGARSRWRGHAELGGGAQCRPCAGARNLRLISRPEAAVPPASRAAGAPPGTMRRAARSRPYPRAAPRPRHPPRLQLPPGAEQLWPGRGDPAGLPGRERGSLLAPAVALGGCSEEPRVDTSRRI